LGTDKVIIDASRGLAMLKLCINDVCLELVQSHVRAAQPRRGSPRLERTATRRSNLALVLEALGELLRAKQVLEQSS
jgi:hypothetical protein